MSSKIKLTCGIKYIVFAGLNRVASSRHPSCCARPDLLKCPQIGPRLLALVAVLGTSNMVLAMDSIGEPTQRPLFDASTDDGNSSVTPTRDPNYVRRVTDTEAVLQAAESNNQLALDLYQHLRSHEGNVSFSPISVSAALTVLHSGAAGLTERELSAVLHLGRQKNGQHGFPKLLDQINRTNDRSETVLRTANRLWAAEEYRFRDSFLKLARDKFQAKPTTVDFGAPEDARRIINDWVERQTRNKIANLIPSGFLQSKTRLVFTNAVYFMGRWSSEFLESTTKPAPFYIGGQRYDPCPNNDAKDSVLVHRRRRCSGSVDAV